MLDKIQNSEFLKEIQELKSIPLFSSASNIEPTAALQEIKSNTEPTDALQEIISNTEPVLDFEAEARDDEQEKRDETQLSFLEQMVDSLNDFKDDFNDLDLNDFGLEEFLAVAGLIGVIALAPLTALLGFFSGLSEMLKKIKFGTFEKIFNPIKNFFGGLKNLRIPGLKIIKKGFKGISKFFTSISNFFKTSDSVFAQLTRKIFKVSKFFGKFLPVFAVFLGGLLGLKDAYKKFKETGSILEGVKTFLISLIDFTVVMFADLIKDFASWIFKKMGFEGITKGLDSFSFSELFRSGMEILFGLITSGINLIKDITKDIYKSFKSNGILSGIGAIVQNLMIAPLNFMKDIGAFILNLLGFDKLENLLNSFEFGSLFKGIIKHIFNGLDLVVNFIKDIFKFIIPDFGFNLIDTVKETATKMLEWLKSLIKIDFNKLLSEIPGFSFLKKLTSGSETEETKIEPETEPKWKFWKKSPKRKIKQTESAQTAIQKIKLFESRNSTGIKQNTESKKPSNISTISNISSVNNSIISNPDMSTTNEDTSLFYGLGA